MKPILLLFIFFSFISCSSNKNKNDLYLENLHGKIKEMRLKTYTASEKNGYIVKNMLWSETITKYNKQGNFTEIKAVYYPDSTTKEVHITLCNYDKNGMKISLTNDKNKTVKDFVKYNKDDLIIETYNYDDFGNLINIEKNNYDDELLVETDIYTGKGVLYSKVIYKRDNKGCIQEISVYDIEGKLYNQTLYTFDSEQRPVTYKIINKNTINSGQFKYGKSDQHNNWLVNIKYSNNKLVGIDERIIKYY